MIKAWSDEAWEVFALRGFVWVDVSGRRQPGDGATHAEPVFPTKGEVATEGAPPARHGGWGARATRRGSHRSSRRNSHRSSRRNSVHE